MPKQQASTTSQTQQPHLRRAIGLWDLTLLCVVAVTNLNVVPAAAAAGPVTIWIWLLALACFFLPQGIAVIELSHRYPGEGGVYLWSKRQFGDFHGFLSGWCYWMTNVFYISTLLVYMLGVSFFVNGAGGSALQSSRLFTCLASLALMVILTVLNVMGPGFTKWINNLGAIGTGVAAASLIGLAIWRLHVQGYSSLGGSLSYGRLDWRFVSAFGVTCFALVGLDLGCLMGDEIEDPVSTVPLAVFRGGVLSGLLYLGSTVALLFALSQKNIGVVEGLMQAVAKMAGDSSMAFIVAPIALVLTISIAGVTSAWFSGSARIPFVAGLDRYLPSALGRIHPRHSTPYVALIVHASLTSIFLVMSFVGASVKEAYLTLLDVAVILQLIPFIYVFAALLKIVIKPDDGRSYFRRGTIACAGIFGLATTILGVGLAFVPSRQIHSISLFEVKLALTCAFFIGVAGFFFHVYGNRKGAMVEDVDLSKAAVQEET